MIRNHSMNTCLRHGFDNDVLPCVFERCQNGRVPQWWGWGGPAGTRVCTVCSGVGSMLRKDIRKISCNPFPNAPCICHWVKEERQGISLRMVETKMDGDEWCAHFDDFVNLQESPAGFGKLEVIAVMNLWMAVGSQNELTRRDGAGR